MQKSKLILLIEDDKEITELLEIYLLKYGFEVFSVSLPSIALEKLKIESYDLVLLDLGLPQMDGLDLCKIIKHTYKNLPVIISTARGDVSDKVVGLEVGADDYIAKPYDPRELVARIQSVLRRYEHISFNINSEFVIDTNTMQIKKNNIALELTMAEYEILSILLSKQHIAISREYIVNSVNSINWDSSDRSIDVIIGRIRQKIGDNSKRPKYIKSIRGVGYKFIG